MNMASDNPPAKNEFNNIDAASVVQSVGHLLRNARMAKGMSIDEVSRQLRLSVPQIEAIEKEDFERIPGRTFLRGFIRNYAHLVQLNPAPLLQMLPASTRVVSTYERTPFKLRNRNFRGVVYFVMDALLFFASLPERITCPKRRAVQWLTI